MPLGSSLPKVGRIHLLKHGILLNHHLTNHHCSSSARIEMKQAEERKVKRVRFSIGSKDKLQKETEVLKKKHILNERACGWIEAFCSMKENDLFCNVDEDFIEDNFNLHGLSSQVAHYNKALKIILGSRSTYDLPMNNLKSPGGKSEMEADAWKLYGLIHRRFILTSKGMDAMLEKFKNEEFERCRRPCCEGQTCLPVGFSDEPGVATVKFFCPRCEDVYAPTSEHHREVDGAYFGPTFPHLLLMTHPLEFKPSCQSSSSYVPRIFGFRIHKPAKTSV